MGLRRIVSFSLFNDIPLYTEGAIKNAQLIHSIYPGWIARFYVDHTVPSQVTDALVNCGSEIVHVDAPSLGPQYGRYWRFWIAAEPEVERFIVRDVDSRLNSREAAAVEAWIVSGKSFHSMRDTYHHSKRILGGMWGGVGGKIPNIRKLTDSWGKYSLHGECDQFMSEVVYPLVADDWICHDSYGHFDDSLPFPIHAPMCGTSFVGEKVHLEMETMDVWRRLGEIYDRYYETQDNLGRAKAEIARLTTALEQERVEAAQHQSALVHRSAGEREKMEAERLETERKLQESQHVISRLVDRLELPGAPFSLKAVLPIARLLRRGAALARYRRFFA